MGYIIDNKEWTKNPDVAIGVTFPFSGKGVFNLSYTTQDQAISNLKNLLLTMKGERYILPNFGTNLVQALFQPITAELKQFINDDISDAISYWLPYINIIDISILTFEDDPSLDRSVDVTLTFSVGQSNSEQSITISSTEGQIEISSTENNTNVNNNTV
jgi:phage baseplate assembly protein W